MPRGRIVGIFLFGATLGMACSAPDGGNDPESEVAVDTVGTASDRIGATPAGDATTAADTALDSRQREILTSAALPSGMNVGMIERGARIFLGYGNCHVCHATDARGARGVGADLTDDEWWNSDGSWEGIIETVENGVASEDSHNEWGAMMPVRGGTDIDDEEVRAAAAYVWSLRLIAPDPIS